MPFQNDPSSYSVEEANSNLASLGWKPVKEPGILSQMGNQLRAATVVDVPAMAGQAMEYASEPGQWLYETGKGIYEGAKERGKLPENQLASDNIFVQGARMIPGSVLPAAAIGIGTGLATRNPALGAKAAMWAGAIPAAMSQGQETYEKGIQAGLTPEQAKEAGRINAAIEYLGETAGTWAMEKGIGILGKAVSKAETPFGAVKELVKPEVLKPWGIATAKSIPVEVGTEMGQAYGQTLTEQKYGIPTEKTPEAAALDVLGPTVGMSTIMAGLGLPGHAMRARAQKAYADKLKSNETPAEGRINIANMFADQLEEENPGVGKLFRQNAMNAINNNLPFEFNEASVQDIPPVAEQKADEEKTKDDHLQDMSKATDVDSTISSFVKSVTTQEDPLKDSLSFIKSKVEDQSLTRQIRNDERFGQQSVSELLNAWAIARNPTVNKSTREKAISQLNEFYRNFENRPNYVFGSNQTETTEVPSTAVATIQQPSVPVSAAKSFEVPDSIEGEAREVFVTPKQLGLKIERIASPDAINARNNAEAEYEAAYQDLVKSDQLALSDAELQQKQNNERVAKEKLDAANARLSEINEIISNNRVKLESIRREKVLDDVLSDVTVSDHYNKFSAELARRGFSNTTPSQLEIDKINRFKELSSAFNQPKPESVDQGMLMGVKEKEQNIPVSQGRINKDLIKNAISNGYKLIGKRLVHPKKTNINLNEAEVSYAKDLISRGYSVKKPKGEANGPEAAQAKQAETQREEAPREATIPTPVVEPTQEPTVQEATKPTAQEVKQEQQPEQQPEVSVEDILDAAAFPQEQTNKGKQNTTQEVTEQGSVQAERKGGSESRSPDQAGTSNSVRRAEESAAAEQKQEEVKPTETPVKPAVEPFAATSGQEAITPSPKEKRAENTLPVDSKQYKAADMLYGVLQFFDPSSTASDRKTLKAISALNKFAKENSNAKEISDFVKQARSLTKKSAKNSKDGLINEQEVINEIAKLPIEKITYYHDVLSKLLSSVDTQEGMKEILKNIGAKGVFDLAKELSSQNVYPEVPVIIEAEATEQKAKSIENKEPAKEKTEQEKLADSFKQIEGETSALSKRNILKDEYGEEMAGKMMDVENNFSSIIEKLMKEQGLEVNGSTERTEANKDCI